MSVLTDQTDEVLKSARDLAEGINKDILGLRVNRLDGILNGEIMPCLGLHTSLIGACIVLARFGSWPGLYILFSAIAAGLCGVYFVSRLGGKQQGGIPGACAALLTAAAACAPIGPFQAGTVVAGAYALLVLLVSFRKIAPAEFLFAPLYSAILMQVSCMRSFQVPLYLLVFCLGILTLLCLDRIWLAFGLFAGVLVILDSEIRERTSGEGGLAIFCILSIIALLVYVIGAVGTANSDFRNFLGQGLVALTTLATIEIFTVEPRPYWLWPLGLAVFFAWVFALRGSEGLPTAIAWICIASIDSIWQCSREFGIDSWDIRMRLLATLALAQGLYLVSRALRNRFVCNLARLILLAGGALCLLFASEVARELVRTSESKPFTQIAEVASWNKMAIGATLALALLASFCVAFSYRSGSAPRSISWWRGLVKPRHAVLVRIGFRVSVKWFSTVPVLGAALKAAQAILESLRYLKTGAEPLQLADLAVLVSTAMLGFSVLQLCDAFLATVDLTAYGGQPPSQSHDWGWLSHIVSWTGCALLVYLYGLGNRQLFFLFASSGFALAPIIGYLTTAKPIQAQQLGVIALTSGLVLVLCHTIRRGQSLLVEK